MIGNYVFRSSIATDIHDYIEHKQSLGRSFQAEAYILYKFDQFLCEPQRPSINLSSETLRQWCQGMESVSSNTRRQRMCIVRNFCIYRRRTNSTCFVPDSHQFPQAGPRVQPYIFSEVDVADMLSKSGLIPATQRSPLRSAATRLAVVLLYTTGLRRGELLRLTPEDFDTSHKTLLIRTSKFYKSRILPLPKDVSMEVEEFLRSHQSVRPTMSPKTPLLWNPYCGGRAYTGTQLRKNLNILFNATGIRKPDGRLPRIHDFRFSFAVNVLLRWYKKGVDVQAKLPYLAAYMGHVSVISSYYYLKFIPALAQVASDMFAANYASLLNQQYERREYNET